MPSTRATSRWWRGSWKTPYWQYFCGFEYFQHELPVDPTTLVKWRQRMGADQLERLLQETIRTAERMGGTREKTFVRVNVDTTVQEKAVCFPTDARLYHRMRERLVQAARRRNIRLRQSYTVVGTRALVQHHRYCHAKQYRRARQPLRKMKTYLGRVVRDVARQARPEDQDLMNLLAVAQRILVQGRKSTNKVYSIHEPDVACIAKGKAHRRYEFGCKVGVVSTSEGNWVVGVRAFRGNPYDGHTLGESLAQAERITGRVPDVAYVDRGYRGHRSEGPTRIHMAGSRSLSRATRSERRRRRRRAAIEPVIGHLKLDNRMGRNHLKGVAGDAINALLAGCGYNFRKLVRAVALFCLWFWTTIGTRRAWSATPARLLALV